MNRTFILSCPNNARTLDTSSDAFETQVKDWTNMVLEKKAVVPQGHLFSWFRGENKFSNSALMFDAVMANVQYAQTQLQISQSSVGKQAYRQAIKAAKAYQFILQNLTTRWKFVPAECATINDCQTADLFGHYCLSRAVAYSNIGKADLTASESAKLVAACNAAHLFTMAASLICGDNASFLRAALLNSANVYLLHGEKCLQNWNDDVDVKGASTALACFTEADRRLRTAGDEGCEDKMIYAHERNSVSWQQPELPSWSEIGKPRVTAL